MKIKNLNLKYITTQDIVYLILIDHCDESDSRITRKSHGMSRHQEADLNQAPSSLCRLLSFFKCQEIFLLFLDVGKRNDIITRRQGLTDGNTKNLFFLTFITNCVKIYIGIYQNKSIF